MMTNFFASLRRALPAIALAACISSWAEATIWVVDSNNGPGTNFTTISDVAGLQPLKLIRVDCVWPFLRHGVFTNTMVTYRAPDQ